VSVLLGAFDSPLNVVRPHAFPGLPDVRLSEEFAVVVLVCTWHECNSLSGVTLTFHVHYPSKCCNVASPNVSSDSSISVHPSTKWISLPKIPYAKLA
jgi:hypothetical protein